MKLYLHWGNSIYIGACLPLYSTQDTLGTPGVIIPPLGGVGVGGVVCTHTTRGRPRQAGVCSNIYVKGCTR